MLNSYDWLNDLPDTSHLTNIVEVRFKGTRKQFVRNDKQLSIKRGDIIVISANGGHDIGEVTLTGNLAEKQFNLKTSNKKRHEWQSILRIATQWDKKQQNDALQREKPVMIRARKLAEILGLTMKIGEVEFRGDGNKAIFYYIAEGRVDFRELIKIYAHEFKIKIEMKQIGARQEAAMVGGIGSCGRELCCSSWRTDFSSITAHAAVRQGLSPNAEKLTGSCGKLKCCLMYELDSYLEAQADFPTELLELETSAGVAKPTKTDILKKQIWYSIESPKNRLNFVLPTTKVKQIINLNKRGTKPEISSLVKNEESTNNKLQNMFGQNLNASKKTEKKINKNVSKNKYRNKQAKVNVIQ
ncbi:MAG: hypothetical protein JW735_04535 [Prolixibacteraceae bacterium]|nr:hypothetical protein [Prolixibacteraceae bacterium]